jgi:UTP--glucose-1-phosphate uridylyltransferase
MTANGKTARSAAMKKRVMQGGTGIIRADGENFETGALQSKTAESGLRKAVILCAGKGTRMLPYTKAQAKEMLPVMTKPLLQVIIEQVKEAGITEILLVISREKECIKKHFDEPDIGYVCQTEMKGTGPATLLAEDFVAGEPFLLIFPDELMLEQNPYKVLAEDFNRHRLPVISTCKIPIEDAHRYGIIIPASGDEIKGIVEKPQQNPPSNFASLGTYILTPDIFKHISAEVGRGSAHKGEVCIADVIHCLPKVRHRELTGKRFDLGSPVGFAKVNIYSALKEYPELKDWVKENFYND